MPLIKGTYLSSWSHIFLKWPTARCRLGSAQRTASRWRHALGEAHLGPEIPRLAFRAHKWLIFYAAHFRAYFCTTLTSHTDQYVSCKSLNYLGVLHPNVSKCPESLTFIFTLLLLLFMVAHNHFLSSQISHISFHRNLWIPFFLVWAWEFSCGKNSSAWHAPLRVSLTQEMCLSTSGTCSVQIMKIQTLERCYSPLCELGASKCQFKLQSTKICPVLCTKWNTGNPLDYQHSPGLPAFLHRPCT